MAETIDAFFAERVAMKLLLTKEELQTVLVPALKHPIFYEPGNNSIASMVREFSETRGGVPSFADIRLRMTLKNDSCGLTSLSEVEQLDITEMEIANLKEEIQNFVRDRITVSSAQSVIEAVQNGVEYTELWSRTDELTANAHFKFDLDLGVDPFGDFDRFYDELHLRSACIRTGWDCLDRHTRGGIPRGGLFVGIAESNFGKTAWLTSLTSNLLALGNKVLYVTAEADAPRIAERVVRSAVGITGDELYRMDRESLRTKIDARVRDGYAKRLFVKKVRGATTAEVRRLLKEHKAKGTEFDVVIVDYLQLFQPTRKLYRANTNEELKWVTNELDDLSYEYNCGMVSVAQVRRDEYSKSDFDLSAIAEGITIAHNSTVVWGLMQTSEQKACGQVKFKLLKNRLGARDVIEVMNANLDYMRFTDLDAHIGPDNRVVLTKIVQVGMTSVPVQNNSRAELHQRATMAAEPYPSIPPQGASDFEFSGFGGPPVNIRAEDIQIDWGS